MTTAVIGTGTLGSVIARLLAAGGKTLRLSSADNESARMLAAEIGPAAVVAGENRDALQGVDSVVLALRFTALEGVIGDEVEWLIRTAGFEPVKAGGLQQSDRLEVGGDFHDLVVGPTEARSLTSGA
jgi:predicted dinucleotide-binding enzyme